MSESKMIDYGDNSYVGCKQWVNNKGLPHREDGPAYEWNDGDKWWCINGQYHRKNGPAVERKDGYKEWWYYGKKLDCDTQEEFEGLIKLELFW